MFKRGSGVTRSLHAPHGVTINGLDNNPRVKRKHSWSSPKVRNAASVGALTHKPVVLKEGFLYKPGLFRIGGRKRRWCVLRTYSQNEASIDIYMDDTKTRFKGTISLDKDLCPMLIVKNFDSKKRTPKNVYLSLKIGKRNYLFTTDSFRELKEWSALLRQAIDNGMLFSGKITEPLNIEDGMVNVKFNSNCIAVICPIKENAIKTWRLNHITSFGQCGGILTFECCSTCSDPGTSRCSINIIQEKSSTVLNLMEKAIRSNPNTSEIHYERSILGDIYHCDHDCGQPQRLLPAYSDPNIYRSTNTTPQKEVAVPIDIHEFEVPYSTLSSGKSVSSGKSNDSGLPGTPLPQQDAVSIGSNVSSTSSKHSHQFSKHGNKISSPNANHHHHVRSVSETAKVSDELTGSYSSSSRRQQYTDEAGSPRVNYTNIQTGSSPHRNKSENAVQYSMLQLSPPPTLHETSPKRTTSAENNKLEPVDENDGIYDTPFEPQYWELSENGILSPPLMYRGSQGSNGPATGFPLRKTSAQSTSSLYKPGSDIRDREEDYRMLPPLPGGRAKPQVKEMVRIFGEQPQQQQQPQTRRSRLHSTGDVLGCNKHRGMGPSSKFSRGSVDNLAQNGRNLAPTNDLLSKLHEQDEMLSKFLARSRNERNEELTGHHHSTTREHQFIKPYRSLTHEELDSDLDSDHHLYDTPSNIQSNRSSTASDRSGVDRVLTKVASDTVRGYAYKIQIPLSNTEYDVPRRAAPAPDLTSLRSDAPPKPRRYITSAEQ